MRNPCAIVTSSSSSSGGGSRRQQQQALMMMLRTLVLSLLVVIMAAEAQQQSSGTGTGTGTGQCSAALVSMMPCLNYISANVPTQPAASCCSALANVVKNNGVCLCVLLAGKINVGVPLNQSRALELPSACKVSTPPVSKCKEEGYAVTPTASTSSPTPPTESSSGKSTPSNNDTNNQQQKGSSTKSTSSSSSSHIVHYALTMVASILVGLFL